MWKFIGFLLFIAIFASVFDYGNGYEENVLISESINQINIENKLYGIFKKQKFVRLSSLVAATPKNLFLVTAAHCVANALISELSVQPGFATTHNKNEMVLVNKIIVHPYYTPPSIDYDIALIKIARPSLSTTLETLDIATVEPSSEVEVATPKNEKEVTLVQAKLENRVSCKGKLAGHVTITRKMLCVQAEGPVPDGGPIIFNSKLAGVASFAVRNSQLNFPKVYTNIANSEIYSFIDEYL